MVEIWCKSCGRKLRNDKSKSRGYGEHCFKKVKKELKENV